MRSSACRNVTEAAPITITIGAQTWPAARYQEAYKYKANMAAVIHGHHKADDIYRTESIYAVGPLPKAKPKGAGGVVFTIEGEPYEWYVACYQRDRRPFPADKPLNPFGPFFILNPWSCGGKIDDGEKPYKRMHLIISKSASTD